MEEGIHQYPSSSDLLADFLKYGVFCGEDEKCEMYYKKLDDFPDKKKTWRSFAFAIDYLIYKIKGQENEQEVEKLKDTALKLIDRFKSSLPREELAFLSEYNVYEATLDREKGLEILADFLDDENRSVKVAPKCHLCYIDKMLEFGEYEQVILYASDGAAEAAQEQEGVDTGYFFYALALSKDALWLKKDFNAITDDIEEAKLILKYYQTAYDTLDDDKDSYFKVISKRYKVIANISGLDLKLNQWRESNEERHPYFDFFSDEN